ncbi:thiol reductant ABC exporter subunit CydD [Pseudarthrobacter sp. J1763]|uniref:thiol reductant ABC exporter subunit CydD n=1 Tax=Pseudarthrobacter sp. J1763 TaxID=3420445 RepID=UPI003D270B48
MPTSSEQHSPATFIKKLSQKGEPRSRGPVFPRSPASTQTLYLLGTLAALKALGLVLVAQAISTGIAQAVAGNFDLSHVVVEGVLGAFLRSLTAWGQQVASRRGVVGVKEELRPVVLTKALAGGNGGRGLGHLALLATRKLDDLDNYYTQYLPSLVNIAAIPLLVGARILFADWVSALIIVLTLPLVPVFMVLIGRYTQDKAEQAQRALARLSSHVLELAKGLPVLLGLGRANAQHKALDDISAQYRKRTMETLKVAFLSALALELIATISVAVVAVFIGVRLVHGQMSLEVGLLALILAPECFAPLRELGSAHHASDDGRVALEEIQDVHKAPLPAQLEASSKKPAPRPAPSSKCQPLSIQDLTVSYEGRTKAGVGPLSFTAPAGSITALDGPSGSGKSSILAALAGVLSDGASVGGTASGISAGDVAYVPQHPVFFRDTPAEELEFFVTTRGISADASKALIRQALDAAAAGHLSERRVSELSPGEMRRVAVARGFALVAAGASVVLLDEPTAHLDGISAHTIRKSIVALRGQTTVLLVSHEPLTRALADVTVPVPLSVANDDGVTHQGDAPASNLVLDPVLNLPLDAEPKVNAELGRISAAVNASGDTKKAAKNLTWRSVKWHGVSAALLGIAAAAFAVALTALSGWLIVRASEMPPILYLLAAIVGVRFFGIGRAVLKYTERLVLHNTVFAAIGLLRSALWLSLLRRAPSLRRLLEGGSVLESVIGDVDELRDLAPRVLLPPLAGLGVAVLSIGVTAWILTAGLPVVIAVVVVGMVGAPLIALAADRWATTAHVRHRALLLRDTTSFLEARADLAGNGAGAAALADVEALAKAAASAQQRTAWAEGVGQAIVVLGACLGAVFVLPAAAEAVHTGQSQAAMIAVVVLTQLALIEHFVAAISAVQLAPALKATLRKVRSQIDAVDFAMSDQAVSDAAASGSALDDRLVDKASQKFGDRQFGHSQPQVLAGVGVRLERLSAGWPLTAEGSARASHQHAPAVFSGVTAHAEPGSWLCVSGPSGSGKSTLLAVLMGFLPPLSGSVSVSGRVVWCPQEAHLFDSTLRGNLSIARPTDAAPSDAEMLMVLEEVGLSDVLATMKNGLDARIGPGGAFLSGGQRQRLAVARTLLSGGEVILLDEPTAHLDREAATALIKDLRHALRAKTVVLVSHHQDDFAAEDVELRLENGFQFQEPLAVQGQHA